ncbi:hypothetical protein QAD02_013895 [Eretmocerus hayati]|uniref:Uncharacterized protein n=1 Tax=Eretmocerus hayati TaxID=131215 RepID=A0ACC2P4S4_9HYME|nr:hypothetical protein QAD02_013895 [Eretmocerus hayati]
MSGQSREPYLFSGKVSDMSRWSKTELEKLKISNTVQNEKERLILAMMDRGGSSTSLCDDTDHQELGPNVDVEQPATDNNPGMCWSTNAAHECASVSSDSDESGHQNRMGEEWSSKNHLISQYNLEPQIPMDIDETNVDDGWPEKVQSRLNGNIADEYDDQSDDEEYFDCEEGDISDGNEGVSLLKADNLEELMNSDGFFERVKHEVALSPGGILMMILTFSLVNSLFLTAMANLLRIINCIFVIAILPQSRYMLDKILNFNSKADFFAACPSCCRDLGNFKEIRGIVVCSCGETVNISSESHSSLFAIVDPSNAIASLMRDNAEYYETIVSGRRRQKGHIKDIHGDGAPVFKSSRYSIWPIYLMINELPVRDRFNNLIVVGYWFALSKPDMKTYLGRSVDHMNRFRSERSEGIACPINGRIRRLKLFTLLCTVDTVARAPVSGHKQFNAYFGCNWCLYPRKWIVNMVKYPIQVALTRTREALEYVMENLSTLMKTKRGREELKGVAERTPLIDLKTFDVIKGFVPDYMHCILAAVAKDITGLLVDNSQKKIINTLLKTIKTPHQVIRLTRGFSDKWKMREWENWLLYYGLSILPVIIEDHMVEYWALLVDATYILLQDDISLHELNKAHNKLIEFMVLTGKYFGKSAMTSNVHQLSHICDGVRNWGPLWAHSCFPFGAGNHTLLKAIKSARGVVISQMMRFSNYVHSSSILERKVSLLGSYVVKNYCGEVLSARAQKYCRGLNALYFGMRNLKPGDTIHQHALHGFEIFSRMVKSGCIFATCLEVNKRSDNTVAQLRDGRYVRICLFLYAKETTEKTICNVIKNVRLGHCWQYQSH